MRNLQAGKFKGDMCKDKDQLQNFCKSRAYANIKKICSKNCDRPPCYQSIYRMPETTCFFVFRMNKYTYFLIF